MRKYAAYLIILVVSLLLELIRIPLIPSWKMSHHIGAFFFQSLTLGLMWWVLQSLNRWLDRRMPYGTNVLKRMLLQITVCVLLLSPILFIVDLLTTLFFPPLEFITPQFKAIAFTLFVLVIALITLSFYGAHFFTQWRRVIEEKAAFEVQAANAEKEKTIIQYQHLKNQVNPHFLFNTLTSLDGLIHSDPPLASKFVRHLAKVYRYILEQPEGEVVSIEQEFTFLNHYLSMLKIKHKEALQITIDIPSSSLDKGIAMVTSQMLIDNAIKHNIVHSATPLRIHINTEDGFLVFNNNKQIRKQIEISTKQGLLHLRRLYEYLTPTPVEINDGENFFQVKLPLL